MQKSVRRAQNDAKVLKRRVLSLLSVLSLSGLLSLVSGPGYTPREEGFLGFRAVPRVKNCRESDIPGCLQAGLAHYRQE